MLYELCYGYVPNKYLLEFFFLVHKLVESRDDKPYDIVEGEIEMLMLSYWKLESQDLKFYNENVSRATRKDLLLYVLNRLKKKSDSVSSNLINSMLFLLDPQEPKQRITSNLLICLKKNITVLLRVQTPYDLFETVAGLIADLRLHNLIFPITFNFLMRNRETTYLWLNSFTDLHNVSDIDTAIRESAMFKLIKISADNHVSHQAVITKMYVYLLLRLFFKNDCQVPWNFV